MPVRIDAPFSTRCLRLSLFSSSAMAFRYRAIRSAYVIDPPDEQRVSADGVMPQPRQKRRREARRRSSIL
ncbi:hypothetical protein RFM23_11310 [Mesorhizobium abyssinicae]|uniref:Uncharacterized protein n=1 Tax=Mesorhizobium abyssinicae TaxID=1209958 RepID=A0ABU5ALS4_9HYPH|nr:hypothetical protein [Mesorhizobium abyssinicae]MDX8538206.1 hypothetical protein [Mesorhizobium abyssinicae]